MLEAKEGTTEGEEVFTHSDEEGEKKNEGSL